MYLDESALIKNRVESLLERMTLEGKAAQLGSVNADRLLEAGELDHDAAKELLADGIGHLTPSKTSSSTHSNSTTTNTTRTPSKTSAAETRATSTKINSKSKTPRQILTITMQSPPTHT
ncbi:hypothetical protein [Halegenticoccus tardaugens]|uniref:hypothetical protein n=1 Tax=Halegenticoccus tardaugens TaxID=2071624 RepID=UPI0013E95FD1|nr:hypothetical protein [Halegenticoccus tardaugens]